MSDRADRRLPRVVVLLGAVSLLTDVHSEAILAVVPIFVAETLGGGALAVGLLEGLGDLVGAGVRIVAGRVSDRAGRRKPLTLLGYGLSTVAKAFWPLAGGVPAALSIRVVDRVGKGLRSAPRDAMIADAVPPERRGAAFGLHRALDTTGAVIGTLLAYALLAASVAPRTLMAWAAIPGALALLLLGLAVREPERRAAAPPSAKPATGPALRLPAFLAVEGLFGVAFASYAFFLLRAREVGVEVGTLPLLYLGSNVVYALLPTPLGRLADRVGRLKVLAVGYVAFAGAAVLASLAHGLDAALLGAFALFGASSAVVESTPRAVVSESLGPARRGTALGALYAVLGFAAVGSGVLYGSLWTTVGSPTLFLVGAGVALLALVALPLARPRRQ